MPSRRMDIQNLRKGGESGIDFGGKVLPQVTPWRGEPLDFGRSPARPSLRRVASSPVEVRHSHQLAVWLDGFLVSSDQSVPTGAVRVQIVSARHVTWHPR